MKQNYNTKYIPVGFLLPTTRQFIFCFQEVDVGGAVKDQAMKNLSKECE